MRFYFYLILISLFMHFHAKGQPGIGSTKALVKIEFEESFGLNITHTNVSLNIDSVEKFFEGTQTNWLNSHLIVTGIRNFEIKVRSLQPYFNSNNEQTSVAVNNIKIDSRINSKSKSIFLQDYSQVLISETNGSLINYIDIKYQILSENTFAFINNKTKTFETLIVYTLIPN